MKRYKPQLRAPPSQEFIFGLFRYYEAQKTTQAFISTGTETLIFEIKDSWKTQR